MTPFAAIVIALRFHNIALQRAKVNKNIIVYKLHDYACAKYKNLVKYSHGNLGAKYSGLSIIGVMPKKAENGGTYMNIYTTDKIRNVVLLGHGGCGKTSLAEAMAYLSGITSRLGKVSDGNTVSDFGKEEQKRKISISTSVIPIEWEGYKINLLDTPGFFDFSGEVEEAISAAGASHHRSKRQVRYGSGNPEGLGFM